MSYEEMIKWTQAHSNIKPETFQKAGNDKYLLHQNIVESEDGEGNKKYIYEEDIIY